ncbi:Intraflagellar transport protein 122 homolog [Geodia barretti]|uniref:Intraflagellar transport protein 122 homolog n=1 Tax=Geodia barretti TaxID=519541 RepID=A0AA35WZ04_GEOBA|nr:Intraflagellar transport protein 122 homolog [Geodia barretti]
MMCSWLISMLTRANLKRQPSCIEKLIRIRRLWRCLQISVEFEEGQAVPHSREGAEGKIEEGGVVANESRELLSKQAEWARNSNNPQEVSDMYLTVGDLKALEIMAKNGWTDRMVNLAHDVDISQEPLLRLCARHLKSSGHYSQAAEVLRKKLGDHKSLPPSKSTPSSGRMQLAWLGNSSLNIAEMCIFP